MSKLITITMILLMLALTIETTRALSIDTRSNLELILSK